MKLTILGTGNAAVMDCYNTCFAFTREDAHFLVDAGGGNQILQRLRDADIPLKDLHDVFVTHAHMDHLMGVIWLIRIIAQRMNQGKYTGEFRIYCHDELVPIIETIVNLTNIHKITKHMGDDILLIPVQDGEVKEILGCQVTFFDIGSTKTKQFGFQMILPNGEKFMCCGDEPYRDCEKAYIENASWLMHEAFCLYREADKFKPYEKHHSTVKEACELAEQMKIPNLILYHTEETHLAERKQLYSEEGKAYYSGNLFVPDDMDVFEL